MTCLAKLADERGTSDCCSDSEVEGVRRLRRWNLAILVDDLGRVQSAWQTEAEARRELLTWDSQWELVLVEVIEIKQSARTRRKVG